MDNDLETIIVRTFNPINKTFNPLHDGYLTRLMLEHLKRVFKYYNVFKEFLPIDDKTISGIEAVLHKCDRLFVDNYIHSFKEMISVFLSSEGYDTIKLQLGFIEEITFRYEENSRYTHWVITTRREPYVGFKSCY